MKSKKMLGLFIIVLLLALSCSSGEDKAIFEKYRTYMDVNANYEKVSREVLSDGTSLMITKGDNAGFIKGGSFKDLKSGDYVTVNKTNRSPELYTVYIVQGNQQFSAKINFETFSSISTFRKKVVKRQSEKREAAIVGFARDLKISEKKMRKIAGKYKS